MQKIAFLFVSLFATFAFAKPKAYFEFGDSFWAGQPSLIVDGKEIRRGFSGYSGVQEAFASDLKAAEYADSYESYQTCGNIALWAGFGAAVAYILTVDRNDYQSEVYWGLFAAGLVPGVVCHKRAFQKLRKAVNQYNGVYGVEPTAAFEIGPATKGLGIAIKF